jgi:hypothetical protein
MKSCGSLLGFGFPLKASMSRLRIAEALPVGAATEVVSCTGRRIPTATIAVQQPARMTGTRARRTALGKRGSADGSADVG